MNRESDAAAHGHTIHQSQIGFWEGLDHRIHTILFGKEGTGLTAIRETTLAQHRNIAASAKPAAALGMLNHNNVDVRVFSPNAERGQNGLAHVEIQGVEGFRAVEGNHPYPALTFSQNVFTHTLALARARNAVQG